MKALDIIRVNASADLVVLGSEGFHTETGTIKVEGHDEVVCYETHVIMVGA